MLTITPDELRRLAPHGDAAHAPALTAAAQEFAIDTPARLTHWLAQIMVETAYLTRLEENLNYSAAPWRRPGSA